METIQSETVFHGRVFDVRLDQVRRTDGKVFRLDVVVHSGAVTLLPVDQEDRAWFIRQYRHPAGSVLLELPAGVMDDGELPEESARRELREEIGMDAGRLEKVGEFFLAPGYSTEKMHVFLATDLQPDPLQMDEDEEIEIEKIPIAALRSLVASGKLQDAKSLAALLLAEPFLTK